MGVLLVELLTKMITFPNSNMNELLAMSLAVHPFSFRSVSLSVRAFVQFFIRQWANSHEDESHHGRDHYHQQLGDRNTILLCVVKYDCSSICLTFCRLWIHCGEELQKCITYHHHHQHHYVDVNCDISPMYGYARICCMYAIRDIYMYFLYVRICLLFICVFLWQL